MTDIQVTLGISQKAGEIKPGQLGLSMAYDPEAAHVLVEGLGFHPSDDGARAVIGMLRDIAEALEAKLDGQPQPEFELSGARVVAPTPIRRGFNPKPVTK